MLCRAVCGCSLRMLFVQVGGQVEVKQPDGHFQQASITKLTDHSTYTVGE